MRVVYIQAALSQYSVPFLEGVRARLATHGVQFDTVFGQPSEAHAAKEDLASMDWSRHVVNRYFPIGGSELVWQPVLSEFWNADLAIVAQENRRLVNYVAQIAGPFRPSKLAFWGHGRNFQSREQTLSERWKRFWATRCDWWFSYTEQTGKLVESYGFPAERITVFNNAIDTSELQRWADEIGEAELDALRRDLGIEGKRVAIYIGGLYDHKRIAFLLEAAAEVHRRMPDFVLLVMGGGVDRPLLEAAAARDEPWLRYLGPRFGREKAALLRLSRAFAMPGLVGLAILDCSALGVPIVTTAYPYHSPEIAYLEPGKSGLMVEDWRSVSKYADALCAVLGDDALHAKLSAGARAMGETYTIERMIACFSDGVLACLAAPRR